MRASIAKVSCSQQPMPFLLFHPMSWQVRRRTLISWQVSLYGSGSKHGGPWLTTENEQNRLPGGQLATVWSSSVHTVYSHCVHLFRLRVENESPTKSLGVNISPTFSLENVVPGSSKWPFDPLVWGHQAWKWSLRDSKKVTLKKLVYTYIYILYVHISSAYIYIYIYNEWCKNYIH